MPSPKNDRKERIMAAVAPEMREIIEPTVDSAVFLEERLEELEKLPFIRYNPQNPMQQKITPASKQYKEFLQQYLNAIKVIERATRSEDKQAVSPLREWAEKRKKMLDNG